MPVLRGTGPAVFHRIPLGCSMRAAPDPDGCHVTEVTARLSPTDTFRIGTYPSGLTRDPHATGTPPTFTPTISGGVRSANGAFRRRIQTASQVKKNVDPCPIQSFRFHSEMSTFRIGRTHFRRNSIPMPAKNATTAMLRGGIVRTQLTRAAGIAHRTTRSVIRRDRISP